MAVKSSGELRLRGDIALEINGSATGSNLSLRSLSAAAGLSSPDSMSELYGYSAVSAPSIYQLYSSPKDTSIYVRLRIGNTGGQNPYSTGFYIGTSTNMTSNPKFELGGGSIYQYKGYTRTGLSPNSTYYWWAYVTNDGGTTYSARQTISTGATYNYSEQSGGGYYPNKPSIFGYEAAGRNQLRVLLQYQHIYNGFTTIGDQSWTTTDAYPSQQYSSSHFMWGTSGISTVNRTTCYWTMDQMWEPQPTVDIYFWTSYWSGLGNGWKYYSNTSLNNRTFTINAPGASYSEINYQGNGWAQYTNTPTYINAWGRMDAVKQ